MKRLLYDNLKTWKEKRGRKPLVLLGARQVGKTYLLKEFGRKEFESMVYVNCHKESYAAQLFRDVDAGRILQELRIHYNVTVTPGKTLLFFDEIQEVRNGLSSLKYFCEDYPEIHIVVAGSLLGISLKEGESYPVGKIDTLRLFPMSFTEYLMARGRERLVEVIRSMDWEAVEAQRNLLISLLREYYFTGGMPEAVKTYLETGDVSAVRDVQIEILDAYRRDIAKHTKPMAQRINMVWDSIPAQLARENKKFMFGAVRRGGRAADFELALQWMVDAGIVNKVYRVREPSLPLRFYSDNSAFKLYMMDCGLLACMSNASPSQMLTGDNVFVEFKGALTENFILQQMQTIFSREAVYYFSKDNSTQEVDFLFETEGRVVPVEVKAEVSVKSKSFTGFINVDHAAKNLKGLRFSLLPYRDQVWMENVSLFAAEEFLRKIG